MSSVHFKEVETQANDIFQELYPSALAFICAMSMQPELNAQDEDAKIEAAGLLAQIAFELYMETLLDPVTKDSASSWLAVQPETENELHLARFWILCGLATQSSFAEIYREKVLEAITVEGKLSLDEEPDSMPQ